MRNLILILTATATAVACFLGVVSAQQSTPKSSKKSADAVTIKGCVAESMGRYMLTQALLVKPEPTPVVSAAAEPAQKARADDQTYELIGAQVKAHAGHRVEIVGTMPPGGSSGNAPASADPSRTAHPIAGTVTVKTVTMISSTCP
jgi:hypothetical protein